MINDIKGNGKCLKALSLIILKRIMDYLASTRKSSNQDSPNFEILNLANAQVMGVLINTNGPS